MATVAELRATPPKAREERSTRVCLRPDIRAEVESLTGQLVSSGMKPPGVVDDGEATGPPPRIGGNMTPEQADLRRRVEELLAEQEKHEGELRLRAIPDGEWRLWADAHPARDEESPAGQRDLRTAGGFVNGDDLIADLSPYLASWNGEPLDPSDWTTWLRDAMSGPEKVAAGQLVVSMQEIGTDFQQLRAAYFTNLARFADSV